MYLFNQFYIFPGSSTLLSGGFDILFPACPVASCFHSMQIIRLSRNRLMNVIHLNGKLLRCNNIHININKQTYTFRPYGLALYKAFFYKFSKTTPGLPGIELSITLPALGKAVSWPSKIFIPTLDS